MILLALLLTSCHLPLCCLSQDILRHTAKPLFVMTLTMLSSFCCKDLDTTSGTTGRFLCRAVFQFDGGVVDSLHFPALTVPTRLSASRLQRQFRRRQGFCKGRQERPYAPIYLQAHTDLRLTVSSHSQINRLETLVNLLEQEAHIFLFHISPNSLLPRVCMHTCGAYQWTHASLVTHPCQTRAMALCHPLGYGLAKDPDCSYTSVSLPSPAVSLLFLPVLAGLSWLLLQPHQQFAVQTYRKRHSKCNNT